MNLWCNCVIWRSINAIDQDDRLVIKYEPIGERLEIINQTIDEISAQ
jgi:hypothetical protein